MASRSDPYMKPLPIKFMLTAYRRRMSPTQEALRARDSPAYWWYMCLRANEKYRDCCKNGGKGKLSAMYADFGDVFKLNFVNWWRKKGRTIFAETEHLKKVRTITDYRQLSFGPLASSLILEVPLTLRRQTVMRQIGQEIKTVYEERKIDVMALSVGAG